MKKRLLVFILVVLLLLPLLPTTEVVAADRIVMTASEFISCLQRALARNTTYNNSYPYNLGYYDGSTISWDCWNLGKSIIWTAGSIVDNYTVGTHARVDTSCGLGDWTGLTIIQKAPNCNGDFTNLIPGEWLYMDGHTGYYIGNGQVIECTTGWGANCVTQSQISTTGARSRNGVRGGTWLYHGMVPWIDYSEFLHQHSYTVSVTLAPGCLTTGVRTYTCNCGASYTETIAALGHKWSAWTTMTASTCTAAGVSVRSCSRCGQQETQSLPIVDHQYVLQTIQPTCTENGYDLHTCSVCGDAYEDSVIPATGHNYVRCVCTLCGAIDPSLQSGDMNLDGQITSADAVLLARYLINLAELNEAQLSAADLNNDGVITSADTVLLAQYLLQ